MPDERLQDPPRNIIILLDGTGNQFGGQNTNLLKLMEVIREDETQLVYYSSGLGTVLPEGTSVWSQTRQSVAEFLDLALAINFSDFVCDAYKYLIDHYREGDKVFLFGFSRGAYTARALAGMVQRVGLLPPGNYNQIPLAYKVYAGPSEVKASDGTISDPSVLYRRIFARSRPASIAFLGVWDTVSSLGGYLLPRLPFASGSKAIGCFRQALALDERRARFIPEYWRSDAKEREIRGGILLLESDEDTAKEVAGRPAALEVWFMGCHSDVGGGNTDNGQPALSNVPFRWMLREAVLSGLQLDAPGCALQPALCEFDYRDKLDPAILKAFHALRDLLKRQSRSAQLALEQEEAVDQASASLTQQVLQTIVITATKVDATYPDIDLDVQQRFHESLTFPKWLWLEFFPLQTRVYTNQGAERDETRFHFGAPRQMVPGQKIHRSVINRILTDSDGSTIFSNGRVKYVRPAARVAEGVKDWDKLTESDEADEIWAD